MAYLDYLAKASLLLLLATVLLRKWVKRNQPPLPPGPKRWPLVGNALQIPRESPWLCFTDWAKQYGKLVFAKVFTRQLVIINDADLAADMLNSVKFSDRPRRRMAELSDYKHTILFMDYGPEVNKSRKLIHDGVGPRSLPSYEEIQAQDALLLSQRLYKDPSRFLDHIRRVVSGGFLKLCYAHEVEDENDELIELGEQVMRYTSEMVSPNRYAVDVFPALNYLPDGWPGTGFKEHVKRNKAALYGLMQTPFEKVKAQMANGALKPSFVSKHLEEMDSMSAEDLQRLQWSAGIILSAGLDTTAGVLQVFFLIMSLFPDVQAKAHAHLDQVVGKGVIPTFKDRPKLPYIDYLLQEIIRWQPPVPIIARSTKTDDVVNGCHIPAGSFVMANVWAFTRNEKEYPEPERFNPDRFAPNKEGQVPRDPRTYALGFGRRGCPGKPLANNIMFITIATILSLFRIEPEIDEAGQRIPPRLNFSTTMIRHPAPFRCRIIPRFPGVQDLVG